MHLYRRGGVETPAIRVHTGRGRHSLFYYELTDTTMSRYFTTGQNFGSYDTELQAYLTQRFGNEYSEFLSQQPIISDSGAIRSQSKQ